MISLTPSAPILSHGNGHHIDNSNFYNPKETVFKFSGPHLPHWDLPGKLQFVTLRLADSLPQYRLEELAELRNRIISGNFNLITGDLDEYLLKIDNWLDQGLGECLFKYEEIQQIIDKALNYYDGKKWDLFDYVIMPNHIHFLVIPFVPLKNILINFRRFTTKEINSLLKREGIIWQADYFDRIIRSYLDFDDKREYIKNNPKDIRVY